MRKKSATDSRLRLITRQKAATYMMPMKRSAQMSEKITP